MTRLSLAPRITLKSSRIEKLSKGNMPFILRTENNSNMPSNKEVPKG
jgi:hypothetical protein